MTSFAANVATATRKPLIGVLCCNESVEGRQAQVVANRFLPPLATIAGATVMLVPALPEVVDSTALSGRLDALLLTGASSHVAASRYGGATLSAGQATDRARDEVALRMADGMIEAGKPVFGICRGLQEINVLFGGSLARDVGLAGHIRCGGNLSYEELFDHGHDVIVAPGGELAAALEASSAPVTSVHHQGIDRLGTGLRIEATAPDGLIEAVSARPNGGLVLGVQWHPEWDHARNPASHALFRLIRRGLDQAQL